MIPHPLTARDLLAALSDRDKSAMMTSSEVTTEAQEAASEGAVELSSIFLSVMTGMPINVVGARHAAGKIADSIADAGLTDWLGTVRRHHEGTYQHCLLVTGVAIGFGLSLGLAGRDIERLYSAAMFHDIGKAKIPLAVLDKSGKLDPEERALIQTHPAVGYDVLKSTPGISPEILDAVRHHHEYLDGSGYPDALCAASISDLVRILTISDIFAALIEDRRYKPPMPRDSAYGIICNMRGKLEAPLVLAFQGSCIESLNIGLGAIRFARESRLFVGCCLVKPEMKATVYVRRTKQSSGANRRKCTGAVDPAQPLANLDSKLIPKVARKTLLAIIAIGTSATSAYFAFRSESISSKRTDLQSREDRPAIAIIKADVESFGEEKINLSLQLKNIETKTVYSLAIVAFGFDPKTEMARQLAHIAGIDPMQPDISINPKHFHQALRDAARCGTLLALCG